MSESTAESTSESTAEGSGTSVPFQSVAPARDRPKEAAASAQAEGDAAAVAPPLPTGEPAASGSDVVSLDHAQPTEPTSGALGTSTPASAAETAGSDQPSVVKIRSSRDSARKFGDNDLSGKIDSRDSNKIGFGLKHP